MSPMPASQLDPLPSQLVHQWTFPSGVDLCVNLTFFKASVSAYFLSHFCKEPLETVLHEVNFHSTRLNIQLYIHWRALMVSFHFLTPCHFHFCACFQNCRRLINAPAVNCNLKKIASLLRLSRFRFRSFSLFSLYVWKCDLFCLFCLSWLWWYPGYRSDPQAHLRRAGTEHRFWSPLNEDRAHVCGGRNDDEVGILLVVWIWITGQTLYWMCYALNSNQQLFLHVWD